MSETDPVPTSKAAASQTSDTASVLLENTKFKEVVAALAGDLPKAQGDDVRDALATYLEDVFKRSGQKKAKPAEVVADLNAKIAAIDALISAQVNEILHDPDFQALEASWRGLESLVINSGLQAGRLEIKVINIGKDELVEHLAEYTGNAIIESPLYKTFYRQNLGILGGAPIGCFVGDYYFDHGTDDVKAMEGMSKLAATCHAPFVSSARPEMFGVKDWSQLQSKSDNAIWNHFETSQAHNKWKSLRKDHDAQYLGLTLFRLLGREPYQKAKGFTFTEETMGKKENYLWVNSVYAMAENLAAAFFRYDWPVQIRGIEGGGLLKRLPQHVLGQGTGADDVVGPAEVTTPNERESVLSKLGFLPVLQIQNSSDAVFIGGQSIQDPKSFFGPDGVAATENAELHARLPYTFAASRILHFVTRLAQNKIGSLQSAPELQKLLTDWLNQYIEPNPNLVSEVQRRQKPLRAAEVTVVPVSGKPGYYDIKLKIRPHYQFEGAEVDLSMSSRVGQEKK